MVSVTRLLLSFAVKLAVFLTDRNPILMFGIRHPKQLTFNTRMHPA